MGTPLEHLPTGIEATHVSQLLKEIGFPTPERLRQLKGSGEYHIIFVLTYHHMNIEPLLTQKGIKLSAVHPPEVILRISGNHFPAIKTENECAILSWLHEKTTIPAPHILAFDNTTENSLRAEYIIMTKEPGECLANFYQSLSEEAKDAIIDQVVDIQQQLYQYEGHHIGGLRFDHGSVMPGPYVSEDHWFLPEIEKYFPNQSFEKLNSLGPFDNYVDYVTANMRTYIYWIKLTQSLSLLVDSLPKLELFIAKMAEDAEKLNRTRICLAHKDLHFANILIDLETARITAVLDWEFSGFVPYQRFDPHQSFLWPGVKTDEAKNERKDLRARFAERAKSRDLEHLNLVARYTSEQQEAMQTAMDYCRAIVEVCPRGQRQELVAGWKISMLTALSKFGV